MGIPASAETFVQLSDSDVVSNASESFSNTTEARFGARVAQLESEMAEKLALDLNFTKLFQNPGLEGHGAFALWICMFIFLVTSIYILVISARRKPSQRLLHYALFFASTVCTMAYLCMANSEGRTYYAQVKQDRQSDESILLTLDWSPSNPPFFYARYVAEIVGFPPRIWILSRIAKVDRGNMVLATISSVMMMTCWLLGGLWPSDKATKWMIWFCGLVFYLFFMGTLMKSFRAAATKLKVDHGHKNEHAKGERAAKRFSVLCWCMALVTSVHPWVWVFAEGTHYLLSDTEVILYSVLDLISFVGFSLLTLHYGSWLSSKHPNPSKSKHANVLNSETHHSADAPPLSAAYTNGGETALSRRALASTIQV